MRFFLEFWLDKPQKKFLIHARWVMNACISLPDIVKVTMWCTFLEFRAISHANWRDFGIKKAGMEHHDLRGLRWIKLLHCNHRLVYGSVSAAPKLRQEENTWDANKLDDATDDDVVVVTDLWLNSQSPRIPFMEACAAMTNQVTSKETHYACTRQHWCWIMFLLMKDEA